MQGAYKYSVIKIDLEALSLALKIRFGKHRLSLVSHKSAYPAYSRKLALRVDGERQRFDSCVMLQEAQLMLTTGSTRLAVSRGQQTWYHSTCYI